MLTANVRDCPPDGLTTRQHLAIAALASGETHAGAAEAARVSPRTLRRWLAREDFQQALRRAVEGVLDDALVMLKVSTPRAITALLDVAENGKSDAARASAAGKLLDDNLRLWGDAVRGLPAGPVPTFIYEPNGRAGPQIVLGVTPKRYVPPISQEARDEVDRLLFGGDEAEDDKNEGNEDGQEIEA